MDVKHVYAAGNSSYILLTNGDLWAWNSSAHPETYIAGYVAEANPQLILTDVAEVFEGSFALKNNGELWAWQTTVDLKAKEDSVRRLSEKVMDSVVHVGNGNLITQSDGSIWLLHRKQFGGTSSLTDEESSFDSLQIAPAGAAVAAFFDGFTVPGVEYSVQGIRHSGLSGSDLSAAINRWELHDGGILCYVSEFTRYPENIPCTLSGGDKLHQQIMDEVIRVEVDLSSGAAFMLKKDGSLWIIGALHHDIAVAFELESSSNGVVANPPSPGVRNFQSYSTPQLLAEEVIDFDWGRDSDLYSDTRSLYLLKSDGTLWAAGNGRYGQFLDNGFIRSNKLIEIATGLTQISAGDRHLIAMQNDGQVVTWGANSHGQLANGETTFQPEPARIMDGIVTMATSLEGHSQVRLERSHSIALHKDGSLWGWGDNFFGQLDNSGDILILEPRRLTHPADTEGIPILAVAAGKGFSLILYEDGSIWEMGRSAEVPFITDNPNREPPAYKIPRKILENAVTLDVSRQQYYALDSSNRLWCGREGLWADDGYIDNPDPRVVAEDVQSFSSGENTLIYLDGAGSLYILGQEKPILKNIVTAAASDGAIGFNGIGLFHYLAVDENGEVWGWGDNSQGQLTSIYESGDKLYAMEEAGSLRREIPLEAGITVPIQLPMSATAVYAGRRTSLFLDTEGNLTIQGRGYAELQFMLGNVSHVASGGDHYLALCKDGSLWSWGSNTTGQLGNGRSEAYAQMQTVRIPTFK